MQRNQTGSGGGSLLPIPPLCIIPPLTPLPRIPPLAGKGRVASPSPEWDEDGDSPAPEERSIFPASKAGILSAIESLHRHISQCENAARVRHDELMRVIEEQTENVSTEVSAEVARQMWDMETTVLETERSLKDLVDRTVAPGSHAGQRYVKRNRQKKKRRVRPKMDDVIFGPAGRPDETSPSLVRRMAELAVERYSPNIRAQDVCTAVALKHRPGWISIRFWTKVEAVYFVHCVEERPALPGQTARLVGPLDIIRGLE
ncbi:hypothetical protein C0992_006435 [Termitomyces sp. T32_za158]|nr:hypothetical protein C0992_006435 [Termitomyces sp. T32_za158]